MNTTVKGGKSFFEKWISLFLLLVLLFHFAFSLQTNLTDFEKRSRFQSFYFEPLFKQNFKIFAPDVPVESTQLYLKFYTATGGWSRWINPGLEIYTQLANNRFSKAHYSFLFYQLAIHNLQYCDSAARYYANKNSISASDFEAFKMHYLATSSEFIGTRKYISHLIKERAVDKQVLKIKCCLQTTQFAAPQLQSKSWESGQPKFAFFEIEAN